MNKSTKAVVIIVLLVLISIIVVMQSQSIKDSKQKHEKLLENYIQLKVTYEQKIEKLETIIKTQNGNDIVKFKNELDSLLNELNEEINYIEKNQNDVLDNENDFYKKLHQYEKKYDKNDKNVVVVLHKRINNQGEEITDLTNKVSDLVAKLEEYIVKYENEKRKNLNLSSKVAALKAKLQAATSMTKADKDKMKLKIQELEKKQFDSENEIKGQEEEMNKLAKKLNKVSVNCYFIYRENNKRKEVPVYLTNEGLSKIYYKYFKNKEPGVVITFTINSDSFRGNLQKLKLIVRSKENGKIFESEIPTSSNAKIRRIVSGSKFSDGQYTVELKYGVENLIIGSTGKYSFQIKEKENYAN